MTKPNRLLLAAGYGLAASLVLVPLSDTIVQVLPIHLGTAQWRFGAVGVASNGLVIPLLGLALACGIAFFAGHRRTLRVLSVLAGVGVLLLIFMSGTFVLDVLQVRRQMRLEAQTNVEAASAHALLKMGVIGLVACLLAIGTWKASRAPAAKQGGPQKIVFSRDASQPDQGPRSPP